MRKPTFRRVCGAGAGAVVTGIAALAVRRLLSAESPEAGGGVSGEEGETITSETSQDPEAVRRYWTPERREAAEPAPMPESE